MSRLTANTGAKVRAMVLKSFSLVILALFSWTATANDVGVGKYLGELKSVGEMVRQARYDEALAKINEVKNEINPNDLIGELYLVYFNNQEGVSYAHIGDFCNAEMSFRAAYNGARLRLARRPDVIADNLVSLANIYIAMNDREKEAEIAGEIQDLLTSKVQLPVFTMLALIKSLATLYVDVGDIGRAEKSVGGIFEAMKIKNIRSEYYASSAGLIMAEIYHRRGMLRESAQKYDESFSQLRRSEGDKIDISVDLANYSRLQASFGDTKLAEASLSAAEDTVKKFRRDIDQALAGVRYRSKLVGNVGYPCRRSVE